VSRPHAAIVVTGSELVRGERTDRNGPFYAREALSLGLVPGHILIVGDDPADLEAALRAASEAEVCLVSGGLGPTHDDRTVELVARVAGVSLRVDEKLEREIESVSREIAERLGRPYADFAAGVTKQATVPEGAEVIGVAGTAPGLVLDGGRCVYVVLPGPPGELRRLWPAAVGSDALSAVLRRTTPPGRHVLRFFGASESAVAQALAEAGGDGAGVEATICARDFEIHVDLVVEPGADARGEALAAALRRPLEAYLFAEDERSVAEIVLELCRDRGYRLGTAESCTGGLVAARLSDVPGASDVLAGGVVAYANDVKTAALGVPERLLDEHGAVSAEVAEAMAAGVRDRLGVDVGIAVTGVAGPGGGTPEKPVGLVHFHVQAPVGSVGRQFSLPGDRATIRSRATVSALHLARRMLTRSGREGA
jgi:competence/damage-inducible protein CinA-like protein